MYRFQYLEVWKKSFIFLKNILRVIYQVPSKYKYSIIEQLIRASLSITNNIAEGSGRQTKKDQNYYYTIAKGSALEVVNMLLLIRDLKLMKVSEINSLLRNIEEIVKMLYSLIDKNN